MANPLLDPRIPPTGITIPRPGGGRPPTPQEMEIIAARQAQRPGFMHQLLGPHMRRGLQNLGFGAEFVGPQADVKDMVQSSQASMADFRSGNIPGGLLNAAYSAAALPMMLLPGTVSGIRKGVEGLSDKWAGRGVRSSISENADRIKLDDIVVPTAERGKGVGSDFMQELTDYADQQGKRLDLTPAVKNAEHGTTSRSRLVDFYKRFGFVENKGRNKDFRLSGGGMYRQPAALPTDEASRMARVDKFGVPLAPKRTAQEIRAESAAPKNPILDEDYRGHHTAPVREGRNTIDDLTDIYPDDVYGSMAWQYYGHGGPDVGLDKSSARIVQSMRGSPNKQITVYRAVPSDLAKSDINGGDWVTINRGYAKQHGESALGGDYEIVSKKVRAGDLTTDGNSIHEWGYTPEAN
jgi:predicted GNAT family acetyltransferase